MTSKKLLLMFAAAMLLAIPFAAYLLCSDVLLGLAILIEHVEHLDLPMSGVVSW